MGDQRPAAITSVTLNPALDQAMSTDQVALWIEWSAWLAFGVLFAIHTTLNLASHYTARRELG